MEKRFKNFRWVLMEIPCEEKDLERIEGQLERLKQIEDFKFAKFNSKTRKKVEEIRDRKIDELLKLYKEAEEIQGLIQTLRPKEKELVELKYMKGFTWKQVAKEMNYSERTVKQLNKKIIDDLEKRTKSDG
jgi:RNA polymerase sigma factor (sigma-70 family)